MDNVIMATHKKRGLGRGLASLIGEVEEIVAAEHNSGTNIDINRIKPGQLQPRKDFDDNSLRELAESIRKSGIIQPIVVRPLVEPDDEVLYEIVAGERRWRASKLVGLHSIPAIIRNLGYQEALELALIENIQRKDLTVLEEAQGYLRLIEEFGYTQEQLAEILGKSRSHITNMVRLLSLPQEVRSYVEQGKLTMGHARPLINNPDAVLLADKIVDEGLSVRQTEQLLKHYVSGYNNQIPLSQPIIKAPKTKDEDIQMLEKAIGNKIGLKISIDNQSDNKGKVTLFYNHLHELDSILKLLSK
jgi:ParB family chromosome partitioning protein